MTPYWNPAVRKMSTTRGASTRTAAPLSRSLVSRSSMLRICRYPLGSCGCPCAATQTPTIATTPKAAARPPTEATARRRRRGWSGRASRTPQPSDTTDQPTNNHVQSPTTDAHHSPYPTVPKADRGTESHGQHQRRAQRQGDRCAGHDIAAPPAGTDEHRGDHQRQRALPVERAANVPGAVLSSPMRTSTDRGDRIHQGTSPMARSTACTATSVLSVAWEAAPARFSTTRLPGRSIACCSSGALQQTTPRIAEPMSQLRVVRWSSAVPHQDEARTGDRQQSERRYDVREMALHHEARRHDGQGQETEVSTGDRPTRGTRGL